MNQTFRHCGYWIYVALAVAGLGSAACGSSGSTDAVCACPSGTFLVSVPADVASVTASGACEFADPDGSGQYSVEATSVGTCHIAVASKSGAAEYDTDVATVRGPSPCECLQGPTAPVVVPELDGGRAGGEGGAQ